jgi:hypothetical protein
LLIGAVLVVVVGVGAAPSSATTTCTWNGSNANWETAGDWDCGHFPTSSDDAVIDSGIVHVTGSDEGARSLALGNGELSIDDHTLTVSSSGSSTLDGFLVVGGALTLGDPTTYAGSQDSGGINVSGTLNIASSFEMTGADGGPANAQINDASGSRTSLVHVLGTGSIVRDTSSGVQTIGPRVDNDGTVSVQKGTLRLAEGDAGSTAGDYSISSGATLAAGSSGGVFEAPTISGIGTLDVAGGDTTVGSTDSFTVSNLHIDGNGTFTLDQDLSLPNLVVAGGGASSGGSRNGTGTLTVTGTADLSDLHLDAGTTTVAASVPSFDISHFLSVAPGATLNLDHATTYAGSSDSNGINVAGTLNIASSFTMSGIDGNGGGTPDQINNSGVVHVLSGGSLVRNTSSGTVTIAPSLHNDGTVSIQTGTLAAPSGLTQAGGVTSVASTATLNGSVTLNGGTLDGDGTIDGSVSNAGGTVAPGSSPGTLTVTGAYTQGPGGTLAEEITGTTPGTQFDQLLVAGAVTLDGTLAIDSTSFTPALTDAFKIISGASSRTGQFASLTGAIVNGRAYTARYDTDGVTLLGSNAPLRTLSVTFAGTGGGSVSDGGSLNCGSSCQHQYPQGAVVMLIATPGSGSTFAGWSGAGCSGAGSCQVTMSAAEGVTATFNAIPPAAHTLTVTKTGTGSGTVTSSPAGITCGSTCSSAYNQGTSVTLTATAASGSTFSGWSGACSGTGSCVLSTTQDLSATATFDLLPVIVTPPVVSVADLFCGVKHRGKCKGLEFKTTFSGPGNAVWQFAAYNPPPGHATAAAKVISLGSIKRKISKPGTQTIVFKLPAGARTTKLYKQIVRLKLKSIRVTLTFTDAAGHTHMTIHRIRLTL